jgi:hypothetical protein
MFFLCITEFNGAVLRPIVTDAVFALIPILFKFCQYVEIAEARHRETYSSCATSFPCSESPSRMVVVNAVGIHTFKPTLMWYFGCDVCSSPSKMSEKGELCVKVYVAGPRGYAAVE